MNSAGQLLFLAINDQLDLAKSDSLLHRVRCKLMFLRLQKLNLFLSKIESPMLYSFWKL